jgi:hypothetical protein
MRNFIRWVPSREHVPPAHSKGEQLTGNRGRASLSAIRVCNLIVRRESVRRPTRHLPLAVRHGPTWGARHALVLRCRDRQRHPCRTLASSNSRSGKHKILPLQACASVRASQLVKDYAQRNIAGWLLPYTPQSHAPKGQAGRAQAPFQNSILWNSSVGTNSGRSA